MKLPSQIELVGHISKIFGKRQVNPRQFNAIIQAANLILKEMATDHIPAPAGCGYSAWFASDERGASSLWLHHFLNHTGHTLKVERPYDAADFRRCVVMLDAIPENREKLQQMRANGETKIPSPWDQILPRWEELETHVRNNAADPINTFLKTL